MSRGSGMENTYKVESCVLWTVSSRHHGHRLEKSEKGQERRSRNAAPMATVVMHTVLPKEAVNSIQMAVCQMEWHQLRCPLADAATPKTEVMLLTITHLWKLVIPR